LATVVADGVMPVEILGNPSALEEGNFNSVVVRRLRLAPVWGPHRFVNNASTPSNGYRVVLAFNPALDSANAPAAQADSTDRHAITLWNGTMAIHANGPYPPLPIKRLERIRTWTDQVWPKYPAERVLVRGALCLGDVLISSGFVERTALEEYDDPEFDQILSLLLLRLMPFRGPA
jgi:hypothetical protein